MVQLSLGKPFCAVLLFLLSHAQNSCGAECKRNVEGATLLVGDDVGMGKREPSALPPSFSFEVTPEFDDGDIGQEPILYNGNSKRLNDVHSFLPRRRGGIMTVTNASVATPHGIVHACSTLYIPGGCRSQLMRNVGAAHKAMSISRPTVRLPRAALIAQFFGEAVFHWFVENVPRLAIVSAKLTNDTKILMYTSKLPKSVWAELLPLLGVDPSQVVPYSHAKTYFVDDLLVPTSTRCGEVIVPAARWLQVRYAAAGLSLYPKPARPYIVVQHRASKKARSIANHVQMVAALESAFPTHDVRVFGNNVTLARAMEMHCHASMIVAPHGAGLSNVLFVCDTARVGVVEIHPWRGNVGSSKDRGTNLCHAITVRSIRVWYSILFGTGTFATPMVAPIGNIVQACTRFLNETTNQCTGCGHNTRQARLTSKAPTPTQHTRCPASQNHPNSPVGFSLLSSSVGDALLWHEREHVTVTPFKFLTRNPCDSHCKSRR